MGPAGDACDLLTVRFVRTNVRRDLTPVGLTTLFLDGGARSARRWLARGPRADRRIRTATAITLGFFAPIAPERETGDNKTGCNQARNQDLHLRSPPEGDALLPRAPGPVTPDVQRSGRRSAPRTSVSTSSAWRRTASPRAAAAPGAGCRGGASQSTKSCLTRLSAWEYGGQDPD